MKLKEGFFLFIMLPFFLGTTYVIKEGGVEVGRWEEDDGKNVVEMIENEDVERPEPQPSAEADQSEALPEPAGFDGVESEGPSASDKKADRGRALYNFKISLGLSRGMKQVDVEQRVSEQGGFLESRYRRSSGKGVVLEAAHWIGFMCMPLT